MKRKSFILLFLFVFIFVMANTNFQFFKRHKKDVAPKDSVELNDSITLAENGKVVPDTTTMDSLQLAVYHHNKAVDDSIRLDS